MASRPNARQLIMASLPGTKAQIIERTGLSPLTVRAWIRKLHAQPGRQICVVKWNRTQSGFKAIYIKGWGKDEPKPLPLTNKQRIRRYKRKARKEGRLLLRKKKRPMVQSTWFSALIGIGKTVAAPGERRPKTGEPLGR